MRSNPNYQRTWTAHNISYTWAPAGLRWYTAVFAGDSGLVRTGKSSRTLSLLVIFQKLGVRTIRALRLILRTLRLSEVRVGVCSMSTDRDLRNWAGGRRYGWHCLDQMGWWRGHEKKISIIGIRGCYKPEWCLRMNIKVMDLIRHGWWVSRTSRWQFSDLCWGSIIHLLKL